MTSLNRRSLLQYGLATGLVGLSGCVTSPPSTGGDADDEPTTDQRTERPTAPAGTTERPPDRFDLLPDGYAVGVETIASGFTSPLAIEEPIADGRLYVADQTGRIFVVDEEGRRDRPFLDVRDRTVSVSGYEERGLLGFAFHPSYPDDARVFVRYSAPRRPGTPEGYSHTFVLSAFTADSEAGTVDPATERTVLEIPQPQRNHNAGAVAFGPDGYLYVGVGDGGGANDTGLGHVDDWYDQNGGGNGQDVVENLLGSVLRLDVDGGDPYAIPPDNPLVGRDGLDEQYAWGFRNPWRFSFSGDRLFVADVGQNRFEEVSIVDAGGNYGWNVMEGTHCFDTSAPSSPPDSCPQERSPEEPLRSPIVEYPQSASTGPSGQAVIGGYVYDGDRLGPLRDRYVFTDWESRNRLFVATPADEGLWPVSVVPIRPGESALGTFVLAFGRTLDGELTVATSNQATVSGQTGAIHRIVPRE